MTEDFKKQMKRDVRVYKKSKNKRIKSKVWKRILSNFESKVDEQIMQFRELFK